MESNPIEEISRKYGIPVDWTWERLSYILGPLRANKATLENSLRFLREIKPYRNSHMGGAISFEGTYNWVKYKLLAVKHRQVARKKLKLWKERLEWEARCTDPVLYDRRKRLINVIFLIRYFETLPQERNCTLGRMEKYLVAQLEECHRDTSRYLKSGR